MKKYLYYSLALAMSMGLAACSSDDIANPEGGNESQPPTSNIVNFNPAQPTKIAFTSNGFDVSNDVVVTWEQVETKLIDRAHEAEIISERLPEKNGNIEGLNTDFLFYADEDMSLEFYPVYSQTSTQNDLGLFYYNAAGERVEVVIWENINPWGLTKSEWVWTEETGSMEVVTSKGVKINIKKGYKFGFYWKGHNNTGETVYYSSSDLNEDVFCTDGNGNPLGDGSTSKIHAATFEMEGKTYLGLEDWTDFDYQDWVFTCDKVLKTVPADDILPGTPNVDPDPTTPPTDEPLEDPAEPEVAAKGGSVEVNLALNEEHESGDWKESHLSIHVRDTTDVTVFIPIEADYYCEADDMMIVQKHDEAYTYNEVKETVSMEIAGQIVTLTVTYSAEGITVSTHGINAEVLKFCREKYNDGITFEVRNYYNDTLTRAQLLEKLNNSTVEFNNTEGRPEVYVNAYGMWEGVIDHLAAKVSPKNMENWDGPSDGFLSMQEESMLYIYSKKAK